MITTLIGFVLLAHGLLFGALLFSRDPSLNRRRCSAAAFACLLAAGLLLK